MESFALVAVVGTFTASGILSIAISVYQYKIQQGVLYFKGYSWNDICNKTFPYAYLRRKHFKDFLFYSSIYCFYN
jgi:hypothetical protein